MFSKMKKTEIPGPAEALPGREEAMQIHNVHAVLNTPLLPPYPEDKSLALFGLGCFWGAEKAFWTQTGVYSTAVGYAAGHTPNPSYEEVCSGMTGHNEVVRVVFDAEQISYQQLLMIFWQSHDPTQGMRQGNDRGTQYRSGIYVYDSQQQSLAEQSLSHYQSQLQANGYGIITTEILTAPEFYYAENYHQQYLAKNPGGYCGLGGVGVTY